MLTVELLYYMLSVCFNIPSSYYNVEIQTILLRDKLFSEVAVPFCIFTNSV